MNLKDLEDFEDKIDFLDFLVVITDDTNGSLFFLFKKSEDISWSLHI